MTGPARSVPADPGAAEIARQGYVEQAKSWQDRAAVLEAENAALREAAQRAVCAVALLRRALDPLTSAGCRLSDAFSDDDPGFVSVTCGQVRAAYRAYLGTSGCLLCDRPDCDGTHPWDRGDRSRLVPAPPPPVPPVSSVTTPTPKGGAGGAPDAFRGIVLALLLSCAGWMLFGVWLLS